MNFTTMTASAQRRRLRGLVLGLVASLSLIAGSCAEPTPPSGGGVTIAFGPLTVPLPPIEVRAPATVIDLGLCSVVYQPPGVQVLGATVTIPAIQIDPAAAQVTVPSVQVRIPNLRVPLSTINAQCLGLGTPPLQADLIIPSTVVVKAATLNLAARTITLNDPAFTLNGAGIGVLGLGDLVVPLPPIVNVPLPTAAIAF